MAHFSRCYCIPASSTKPECFGLFDTKNVLVAKDILSLNTGGAQNDRLFFGVVDDIQESSDVQESRTSKSHSHLPPRQTDASIRIHMYCAKCRSSFSPSYACSNTRWSCYMTSSITTKTGVPCCVVQPPQTKVGDCRKQSPRKRKYGAGCLQETNSSGSWCFYLLIPPEVISPKLTHQCVPLTPGACISVSKTLGTGGCPRWSRYPPEKHLGPKSHQLFSFLPGNELR